MLVLVADPGDEAMTVSGDLACEQDLCAASLKSGGHHPRLALVGRRGGSSFGRDSDRNREPSEKDQSTRYRPNTHRHLRLTAMSADGDPARSSLTGSQWWSLEW